MFNFFRHHIHGVYGEYLQDLCAVVSFDEDGTPASVCNVQLGCFCCHTPETSPLVTLLKGQTFIASLDTIRSRFFISPHDCYHHRLRCHNAAQHNAQSYRGNTSERNAYRPACSNVQVFCEACSAIPSLCTAEHIPPFSTHLPVPFSSLILLKAINISVNRIRIN